MSSSQCPLLALSGHSGLRAECPLSEVKRTSFVCDDFADRYKLLPSVMEVPMALQLRPTCEYCDKDLPPDALTARICSYNAHFARIALKRYCRMSARTVVAASRRDRSAQRQNGAQAFLLQSVHPQPTESACPTVLRISQLTRYGLSTHRQKTVDASPKARCPLSVVKRTFTRLPIWRRINNGSQPSHRGNIIRIRWLAWIW